MPDQGRPIGHGRPEENGIIRSFEDARSAQSLVGGAGASGKMGDWTAQARAFTGGAGILPSLPSLESGAEGRRDAQYR